MEIGSLLITSPWMFTDNLSLDVFYRHLLQTFKMSVPFIFATFVFAFITSQETAYFFPCRSLNTFALAYFYDSISNNANVKSLQVIQELI